MQITDKKGHTYEVRVIDRGRSLSFSVKDGPTTVCRAGYNKADKFIETLETDYTYQRRGIGTALVKAIYAEHGRGHDKRYPNWHTVSKNNRSMRSFLKSVGGFTVKEK